MPPVNPARWRELSPHLDEALDVPADARASWLAALSARDPALAADLQTLLEDHALPVRYQIPEPPPAQPAARANARGSDLYIHPPRGRIGRATDEAMERFVDETRMGVAK